MSVSLARRAEAEREIRRRQRMRIEAAGLMNAIPDDMTFLQWCQKLADDGMKVDGKPFRLDNRPALVPIYEAIPTTRAEAFRQILVIQKATQLGLTVWEVLANIYMAVKWGPVTIGMFMPDQATASYKSEHRFMRIVRSVPTIYQAMTEAVRGGAKKSVGEGNVLTRTMGESIFLFLWTSGKVSTESRPMDVVTLDEVQEMDLAEIDKVRARTGDSDVAYTLLLSTANMPEMDINFWYLLGTQEVWHTRCPHCDELSDLTDPAGVFPAKSIGYNTGQFPDAPLNEYVWLCPVCAGHILDPQVGEYIAAKPGASFRSFMLPRTISPRMTPREMIEAHGRAKTGDQKKSFYNRTLARPYIDADQLPVTMAHCLAAVEAGRLARLAWLAKSTDCYMGIDQMGGFHAVIIKRRMPDGRQAVVHVEAVFESPTPDNPDNSPWRRSAELMNQFGVAICVVEQLPNVDAARSFCNKFPGRAFMAGYADLKTDHMVWGDAMSRSDMKTAETDRSRYTVILQQYRCMQRQIGNSMTDGGKHQARLAETLTQGIQAHASGLKSFEQAYEQEIVGVSDLYADRAASVLLDMAPASLGPRPAMDSEEYKVIERHALGLLVAAMKIECGKATLRTLHIEACMHVAVRWNKGQKFKANDFFDYQHASAAVGYCDAFFTERSLRSVLMRSDLALDKLYGCTVVWTPEAALEYVSTL